MKIHLYQVIVVAISSVMLYLGIKEFVNRETGQTLLKLFVRLAVWGGMALIAIYPDFTLVIARIMGVVDNFNAVVLMGFLMVFLMLFKLLSAIEKIEQNVSEITRKEALHTAHERIEEMRKEIKAQQGRNALCTSQQQNISPRKQDD
ncbi:MAG: DUF2304 domain-containing protein [Candidatus Electrothrix sp. AW2]|jgi:hypothetical protein|nr:DUF2304 domain-containing protein [Candidatus Electrothrix sp. AX1]MCI5117349.1 DUF2304 domain-containing protein [Candidatus Electrothrix gigas]MCI5135318.1 DUF2304 domain-containing protein [Candidatus Electrothrix gigas]MCI5183324.1 DUF2304 domain-containing protein [Candidatus Electrothrix gigas]MCI5188277.1 DUF2304 domain-containing protein [Candidatus Electrothrix gigas]